MKAGALLVAGNCIGAGIVALPLVAQPYGLMTASFWLAVGCLFMLSTAVLLLAVNAKVGTGKSLISMAHTTLGWPAAALTWATYIFLFTCLLVAYFSFFQALFASQLAAAFVLFGIAAIVFFGFRCLDISNRLAMLGLFVSYAFCVAGGLMHFDASRLASESFAGSYRTLPIMVVCFGFHNIIPSLLARSEKSHAQVRGMLLMGSLLALIVYLLWMLAFFGGKHEVSKGLIDTFSFFAVVTSLTGVVLGFLDFLTDGFKLAPRPSNQLALLAAICLVPIVLATVKGNVFLQALDHAGSFGAGLLFGVLPCSMALKTGCGPKWLVGLLLLISIGIVSVQFF